jgi:hypothetical protein
LAAGESSEKKLERVPKPLKKKSHQDLIPMRTIHKNSPSFHFLKLCTVSCSGESNLKFKQLPEFETQNE